MESTQTSLIKTILYYINYIYALKSIPNLIFRKPYGKASRILKVAAINFLQKNRVGRQ